MSHKLSNDEFLLKVSKTSPNTKVIGEYVNVTTKVEVECLICGNHWNTTPSNLFKGSGCIVCYNRNKRGKSRTKTHNEFVSEMQTINPLVHIQGEYIDTNHKIEWECLKCGKKYNSYPLDLLNGHWCRKCKEKPSRITKSTKEFIEQLGEINNKWIIIGEYNGIRKKIDVRCSNCGYQRSAYPNNLLANRCSCPQCSDGISYPNKFSRAFIQQLPVTNVIYEYSPSWIKPSRYDNYFEYNSKAYILEMDGSFHYQNTNLSCKSLDEIKAIDLEKEKIAILHNITVIRIDCQKSKMEYIKNSIKNSELSKIFDLSKIDWDLCDKYACNSIIFKAYESFLKLYTQEKTKGEIYQEIANEYHINYYTVIHYISKAKTIFKKIQ